MLRDVAQAELGDFKRSSLGTSRERLPGGGAFGLHLRRITWIRK